MTNIILGWFLLALLVAVAFGWLASRRNRASDDREQIEYLDKWSAAKRERDKLPIMLRKQCD